MSDDKAERQAQMVKNEKCKGIRKNVIMMWL
jgi:hypothetical protein